MFYLHRRHKNVRFILFLVIALVCSWLAFNILKNVTSGVISPLASNDDPPQIFLFSKKPKDASDLVFQIKQFTQKRTGVYSVYIVDLSQNSGFGFNENTIFTAASVNKVPILATLYYEAQNGKIDLDRRITVQASDIQDFGTGSIRYEGPGSVYSLKSLAQLMIQKSDNTAAFILTRIIGESRIQTLVENWGLTQTDMKNNKTSNKDTSELFKKIYKGQIANQALTQEMLGFLKESDFENRLPRLLPKDISVYHKIGSEIGNIHDVGIIALENRPYYIGVLTNDVTDESTTETTIADISKKVFDFMTVN